MQLDPKTKRETLTIQDESQYRDIDVNFPPCTSHSPTVGEESRKAGRWDPRITCVAALPVDENTFVLDCSVANDGAMLPNNDFGTQESISIIQS